MFIWDFVADTVLGQILDWIYGQIIGFLGNFFSAMGGMGAELFEMSWVKSIVLFFVYLSWMLYGTGLVVSMFECAIEYQSGRGSIRDTALNAIKGLYGGGTVFYGPGGTLQAVHFSAEQLGSGHNGLWKRREHSCRQYHKRTFRSR